MCKGKKLVAFAVLISSLCLLTAPAGAAEAALEESEILSLFSEKREYPGFSDVPADAWYAPYIAVCYETGLMSGTGPDTFSPNGYLSEMECLAVAARLHNRLHGGGDTLPQAPEDWGKTTLELHGGRAVPLYGLETLDGTGMGWLDGNLYLPKSAEAWGKGLDGVKAKVVCAEEDYGSYTGVLLFSPAYDGLPASLFLNVTDTAPAEVWAYPEDLLRLDDIPPAGIWYRDTVYYFTQGGGRGVSDAACGDCGFGYRGWLRSGASRDYFAKALHDAAPELLNARNEVPSVLGVGREAGEYILPFYRAGILVGVDEYGSFDGGSGLTRAELAAMLARMVRPALRLDFDPAEPEYRDYTLTPLDTHGGAWPARGYGGDWDIRPEDYRQDGLTLRLSYPEGDGFIDREGNLLAVAEGRELGAFNAYGLAEVKEVDGGYSTVRGVINQEGRLLFPELDGPSPDVDIAGPYAAARPDFWETATPYTLYNADGETVGVLGGGAMPYYYGDGLLPYDDPETGNWGYQDLDGNVVIPPPNGGNGFHEGLSFNALTDGSNSFIDTAGRAVITGLPEASGDGRYSPAFSEGYCAYFLPGEETKLFPGLSRVSSRCGLIDRTGKLVLPYEYSFIGDRSEGMCAYAAAGGSGYVDPETGVGFESPYAACTEFFSSGYAAAYSVDSGLWGYLGREGKLAVPLEFEYAGPVVDGSAFVVKDGSVYLLTFTEGAP